MGIRIEASGPLITLNFKKKNFDWTKQDEVLVGKEHATVLTVNAPKEVGFVDFRALILQLI
jgi:hypothetical protein